MTAQITPADALDRALDAPGGAADVAAALARLDAADDAARRVLRTPAARDGHELAGAAEHLRRSTVVRDRAARSAADARIRRLRRVQEALARLESCDAVDDLLPAAARELAGACGFDRTVISRRRGETWRAEAVWTAPDLDPAISAATERYLRETWIPMGPKALEADLVRRRTADLVMAGDPRTTAELMAVSHSPGYVAAPVMPTGEVIGFLQADRLERVVTADDRDALWTFAEGFGLVFERVALGERMETQLARVREAFRTAEAGLAALSATERDLFGQARRAAPAGRGTTGAPLTRREREILDLMATGEPYAAIADRIVVGETTVKSHVHVILRKLGATGRADAVARYLRARTGEAEGT